MTTKDIALQTIERLPSTATWADIEERVRFLAAIDRGLDDIRAGRVIPHADVKRSLGQWLSKLSGPTRLAKT
jgi:predicted transcriptional regulator